MENKKTFIKRDECAKFDWYMTHFPGSIFIYDTETTGVNVFKDYIVQLSAIKLVRDPITAQYKIAETFNQYMKPPIKMPEKASAVNHITDEFLSDKPTEKEAFPIIRNFFKDVEAGKGTLLGYNNKRFDDSLINNLYLKHIGTPLISHDTNISLDAKIMAEEIVLRKDVPDQMLTLTNVGLLYGIHEDTMHDAMTDIRVTGNVAFHLYEDYIDHFKSSPYAGKSKIAITGMYNFKKSKTVNYIMISGTLITPSGEVIVGKIRYDIWNKCYTEEEGNLFQYGDLNQFVDDANIYAGGNIAKFNSAKRKL